jgi:hypothetical protein
MLLKHNDEMIYPAWIIYMNRFLSNSKCTPLKNASMNRYDFGIEENL